MARGSESKEKITKKILEVFPKSFLYNNDKEIRIPINENGEIIQIKCVLSAAKINVEPDEDTSINDVVETNFMNSPTEEEIARVQTIAKKLGLV